MNHIGKIVEISKKNLQRGTDILKNEWGIPKRGEKKLKSQGKMGFSSFSFSHSSLLYISIRQGCSFLKW